MCVHIFVPVRLDKLILLTNSRSVGAVFGFTFLVRHDAHFIDAIKRWMLHQSMQFKSVHFSSVALWFKVMRLNVWP